MFVNKLINLVQKNKSIITLSLYFLKYKAAIKASISKINVATGKEFNKSFINDVCNFLPFIYNF